MGVPIHDELEITGLLDCVGHAVVNPLLKESSLTVVVVAEQNC